MARKGFDSIRNSYNVHNRMKLGAATWKKLGQMPDLYTTIPLRGKARKGNALR